MKVIIEKNNFNCNYKLIIKDISKEKELVKVLNNNSIQYKKTTYFKDFYLYNLNNINKKIIDTIYKDIESFVREISPMSVYSLPIKIDNEKAILNKKIKDNIPYVTLGVIDNGVFKNYYLENFITDVDNPYLEEETSYSHGTFVTGVALYGDELENKNIVGNTLFNIFDATVLNKETIEEDELLKNICNTIEKYHNKIKIWNLSLSVRVEISEDYFSTFGVVLDYLQKKYNILICKSCGNSGAFMKSNIKRKLYHGSDSQLSLTTGSINNHNIPSNFSRIGYASLNTIKPDLVSYGGELIKNDDGTMGMKGVFSFNKDGNIVSSSGTSFANARVSSLCTSIYQKICRDFNNFTDFNREFIKCLILHSSDYLNENWKIEEVGFGMHKNLETTLSLIENKNVLIIKDKMRLNYNINLKSYFTCTFPSKFKITLVYDTEFDYFQNSTYIKSNIYIKDYIDDGYNLVKKITVNLNNENILLYSDNNIEKNFVIIIEKL